MDVTVRQLDGVPRISRDTGLMPADERRLVMLTAFLIAAGLFVSGLAPFLLVLGILFACALTEAVLLVDTLLALRRPIAEVHELPRRGPRRR